MGKMQMSDTSGDMVGVLYSHHRGVLLWPRRRQRRLLLIAYVIHPERFTHDVLAPILQRDGAVHFQNMCVPDSEPNHRSVLPDYMQM